MSKHELIASLTWKVEKWRNLHKQNPSDVYLEMIANAEKELQKLHHASQNKR